LADEFGLLTLDEGAAGRAAQALAAHPLADRFDLGPLDDRSGDAEVASREPGALALRTREGELVGAIRRADDLDESLSARVLLENLANKATATLALHHLLADGGVDPASIDYVISCSEEAVGDRYQRGGGNMAKAVAVACGLQRASGCDVKNFCAGPIVAMAFAAGMVGSGIFRRVAVVGGGSLPKLGMKFQGHLKHGLPVLEDVLGACAYLVEAPEAGTAGAPRIRLDAIARHPVSAGGSNPQIMEALAIEPLERIGLRMLDVDDWATELHDPDVTEPQGSGNVPDRNYRTIAALAIRRGELARDGVASFVAERGMPGFAPTQGHLASAVCYLPHAMRRLRSGDARFVSFVAKGSLFLGRMCQLSDGMSVLLEAGD
ncbi:MAG TPA: DUF5940 domain-containing protein, partial [Candidatus Dormibacteraeota bacterium]|nr:DUF5940 domain-containing protein [Candidatus Dormibacteraeota bacterium]